MGIVFNTYAENVYDDQFQAIRTIELYEVSEDSEGNQVETIVSKKNNPDFLMRLAKSQGVQKVGLGEIIMVTKELIALGKLIYPIVEAGKPVVTINSVPVEVLPRDEKGEAITAMQLNGWQNPKVARYKVKVKNYLGVVPASIEFLMIFTYGGSYNGAGKYITGAQIKPIDVMVKWGYKLDAEFKVQTIMNQGTQDNPVAGAVLMIDYNIKTIMQEMNSSKLFHINGNGEVNHY